MQDPNVLRPAQVFISYSHHDEGHCRDLQSHLSALRRTGKISTWHDRRIGAGAEWRGEIDTHLAEAEIVLLLVSADFIESDYCYDVELKTAVERHKEGLAVVIPIIVRPVDVTGTPLADLQSLPSGARPITTWDNKDSALRDVTDGIKRVVDNLVGSRLRNYQASTAATWLPQNRVLDAAIASEVPVNESREVSTMIRLPDSDGLKIILELEAGRTDRTYSSAVGDVRSQGFILDFPLSNTVIRPPKVIIKISAPGFEPVEQTKTIQMPTLQDSPLYSFSLRADREGLHVVNVELICEDVTIVEQLLRARVGRHGGPKDKSPSGGMVVLAEIPLKVMCVGKAAWNVG